MGDVKYFRHDVPPSMVDDLTSLPGNQALGDTEKVATTLSQHGQNSEIFRGKTYFSPSQVDRGVSDNVVQVGDLFTACIDGKTVSRACSSRENETGAELAVEMNLGFQRKEYARQAAFAWAHRVTSAGKVAFYSHEIVNTASEALGHSLGVRFVATVTAYEKPGVGSSTPDRNFPPPRC